MRDPRRKDPEAPIDMVEPGDMDQTRVAMCKYIRESHCKSGNKCKFSHPQEAPTPDGDRMSFVPDKRKFGKPDVVTNLDIRERKEIKEVASSNYANPKNRWMKRNKLRSLWRERNWMRTH
jgi:hypothetical protein